MSGAVEDGGIRIRDATREDGPALSAINRACPIVSGLSVIFERGDDFFAWPDALYERHRYVVIEADGERVGYCMVGEFRGFTGNGLGTCFYTGDARVLPAHRGRGLTQRALWALEQRVSPEAAVGFGLVKRGNRPAERIAATARGHAFAGEPLAELEVASVPLLGPLAAPGRARVRRARPDDAEALATLFHRTQAGRLFAPESTPAAFAEALSRRPEERHAPIYVAESHGRPAGTATAWDLAPLRCTRVIRDSLASRGVRLASGLAARVLGRASPLPSAGAPLRALTLTRVAVQDQDPAVFRDLLAAIVRDHLGLGYHVVQAGFVADDPLREALRGTLRQRFVSTVYRIARVGPAAPPRPAGLPYIDIAMI